MLGVQAGLRMSALPATRHLPPPEFANSGVLSQLAPRSSRRKITTGLDPRSLVDPAIWSGPLFHVDSNKGDDGRTGLGGFDGDFSQAVRTIYRAFELGNATGAAYRVGSNRVSTRNRPLRRTVSGSRRSPWRSSDGVAPCATAPARTA